MNNKKCDVCKKKYNSEDDKTVAIKCGKEKMYSTTIRRDVCDECFDKLLKVLNLTKENFFSF